VATAQALSRLPSEAVALGVTSQKQSPTFAVMVTPYSPDGRYDALYLRNYANIKIKDELARLPGVGQIRMFGSGDTDSSDTVRRGTYSSEAQTRRSLRFRTNGFSAFTNAFHPIFFVAVP